MNEQQSVERRDCERARCAPLEHRVDLRLLVQRELTDARREPSADGLIKIPVSDAVSQIQHRQQATR